MGLKGEPEKHGRMPESDEAAEGQGLIRNPQDFLAGLVLIGVAALAFWAARPLAGMHGFSFGAGTMPRLFAGGLLFFGALIAAMSLAADGPRAPRYAWRGPLFITAAVVLFALTVRPWGLILSSFSTLILASVASAEVRPVEAIVWAAALTLFCAGVFSLGLGLPLPLWPP